MLTSRGTGRPNDQPLYDRLWGAGFLPTQHQGVKFRNAGDPVLYLSNPTGIDRALRRDMLDRPRRTQHAERTAPSAIPRSQARIAQYEMAFRMQSSVPELTDISGEPKHVLDLYGPDVTEPGHLRLQLPAGPPPRRARRALHPALPHGLGPPRRPAEGAQGAVPRHRPARPPALLDDLKQRGLLDDTLLVWGGEFGRTIYSQGALTETNYGRDHHPRCFTMLLAGAGVKPGISIGATDDYCYNITEDPVHVHDLNATILHLLGIDHERLTYKFQGREFRLTDVHGELIHKILS